MKVYDLLAAQFEKEFQFNTSIWSFAALQAAELSKIAFHDALSAKLIIIAAQGSTELPAAVRSWVQSWLPAKKGQTAALVSLLDHSLVHDQHESPVRAFLKNAADQAGLEFMVRHVHLNGKTPPEAPVVFPTSSLREETFRRPSPDGWGINE